MIKLELSGPIFSFNEDVRKIREALKNEAEDIELDINSPGGVVSIGIDLFNRIQRHKGRVDINILGQAASMASYVALAGDSLSVSDNSIFMIHNASGVAIGDYREMGKYSELLNSITDLIARKYVESTGKSMPEVRKKMDDETYFFGKEIMEYGFADELKESREKRPKNEAIATAKADFLACMEEMKAQTDNIEAIAPIKKHKERIMDLTEIMAKYPGVKAEVDAIRTKGFNDGFETGKKKVEARITAASPFLTAKYPEAINNLAVEVLKGDQNPAALTGAVVAFDAISAKEKIDGAENAEDVKPEESVSYDGVIRNEADFQRAVGGE